MFGQIAFQIRQIDFAYFIVRLILARLGQYPIELGDHLVRVLCHFDKPIETTKVVDNIGEQAGQI